MWPFSRRRKEKQVPKLLVMPPSGDYDAQVVGESRYQKNLDRICGGKTEGGHKKEVSALLFCENDNPYDKNAVRVEINELTVGYLPRKDAVEHRQALEETGHPGLPVQCMALIVGGWCREDGDTGHYGVRLDLPEEE